MSVAKSYAQALFEAAQEQRYSSEALNSLEEEVGDFVNLVSVSKEVASALFAPITTEREKKSFLEAISKASRLSPLFSNFLMLLAKKNRLVLIQEIQHAFSAARLLSEGGVSGDLVVADPMNQDDVEGLAKAFGQKIGKRVAFRVSVDPTLLAGMKVTVNGVTYDGTLRSQLQRLRDRFVLGFAQD